MTDILNIDIYNSQNNSSSFLRSYANSLRPNLKEPAERYPMFDQWYKKVSSSILFGDRSFIVISVERQIAAYTILKHSDVESKICTIYVNEPYRNHGLGTRLMQASLNLLIENNRQASISLNEDLISELMPLLDKFGFSYAYKCPDFYKKGITEYFCIMHLQGSIPDYSDLYQIFHELFQLSNKSDHDFKQTIFRRFINAVISSNKTEMEQLIVGVLQNNINTKSSHRIYLYLLFVHLGFDSLSSAMLTIDVLSCSMSADRKLRAYYNNFITSNPCYLWGIDSDIIFHELMKIDEIAYRFSQFELVPKLSKES